MTSPAGAEAAAPPLEEITLAPGDRRETVFRVIRAARARLILSVFRCNDYQFLAELLEARKRDVRVEALLTPRAQGWKKKLKGLELFLQTIGAEVHRDSSSRVTYHSKYMVSDDRPAKIA